MIAADAVYRMQGAPLQNVAFIWKKGKRSPYSITKHRVQERISVFDSQPAGDVSHKPSSKLPLLSARPAVTPATLKRAATNFAAWWTEAQWVWTVCLRLLPDSSRLRFEPGPFCTWVQHANHSATEPPPFVSNHKSLPFVRRWTAFRHGCHCASPSSWARCLSRQAPRRQTGTGLWQGPSASPTDQGSTVVEDWTQMSDSDRLTVDDIDSC